MTRTPFWAASAVADRPPPPVPTTTMSASSSHACGTARGAMGLTLSSGPASISITGMFLPMKLYMMGDSPTRTTCGSAAGASSPCADAVAPRPTTVPTAAAAAAEPTNARRETPADPIDPVALIDPAAAPAAPAADMMASFRSNPYARPSGMNAGAVSSIRSSSDRVHHVRLSVSAGKPPQQGACIDRADLRLRRRVRGGSSTPAAARRRQRGGGPRALASHAAPECVMGRFKLTTHTSLTCVSS